MGQTDVRNHSKFHLILTENQYSYNGTFRSILDKKILPAKSWQPKTYWDYVPVLPYYKASLSTFHKVPFGEQKFSRSLLFHLFLIVFLSSWCCVYSCNFQLPHLMVLFQCSSSFHFHHLLNIHIWHHFD